MANRIKTAFKSLLGISTNINSIEKYANGQYFLGINISANIHDTDNIPGQLRAYNRCAPLSGIIQRKARAINNGKVFLMDDKGKESNVALANDLRKLLAKPNALQTWPELMNMLYTMLSVFGECFVFALKAEGFKNTKSLWVIPNWLITVETSGKMFLQTDVNQIITGYKVNLQGESTSLKTDDVIHIKDSIINSTYLTRGQSRLVALRDPISNIIAAYEARNVLITKRGAIGILTNNSKDVAGMIPLEQIEKDKLQDEFKTYGLNRTQSQVIITSASLQWQSMTYPTKDLMLFEEIEDDVRQIADNFEYPMYLLGFKNGSTFSNVAEAKKALYQDAIIPEAESIYQAFTSYFDTQSKGFSIKVFFDHLDILQKSEKDKAEAFKLKNEGLKIAYERKVITREEYRIALDYDPTKFEGETFYEVQPTNNVTVN